jgi:hypothetical protein
VVRALYMLTRCTCLPAFTLLCTMPGIAALKLFTAASPSLHPSGVICATNTSVFGAVVVMWSISVDSRFGAVETL